MPRQEALEVMASIWDMLFSDQDYRTTAPAGGYADLYQGGLLARNRDQEPTSVEAMRASQDFIPGLGDVLALGEAGQALSEGDRKAAALLAAGGLLGVVPGVGDALARPVIAAGRKAADFADRIQVDPNAFGSMGGNVRLRPQAGGTPVMQGRSKKGLEDFFNPDGLSWGTTNRETAEQFAGRNEVYWPYRDPPESTVEFSGEVYDLNFDLRNPMDVDISQTMWDRNKELALVSEAKAAGHDGLRISHPGGKIDYVAFDPSQVSRSTPSSPAQEVAGLLSSGRADEVTDEMLAKFTPNDEMEIFDLYQRGATGMDLPMDEASRMARKREMEHGRDLFHGGKGGYNYLSADAGTGKTTGTGAFVSPSNLLAETYSPVVDGAVYPVSSRSSAPIVSADMQNWNNIEAPVYAYDPRSMEDIEVIGGSGRASTDDIAREARGMLDAVEIQDVSDRGPRAWGTTQYPPISDVRVEYDPSNIRSRFARFDPRLAHLRNLSAGVGGLGLLGMSYPQEDQY